MRPLRPSGVAWTSWKPAELQTWVRIPARASLRRVLRATPTVHCGSDLRPSANFGSGFKPGSSHRSASMASPHPCLLVLALSVVAVSLKTTAMSNSATAIQSREDSPRQGTLPAEPHTSSASKLNSVAADRDLRIRPVQAGPSPSTPKAAIPVEGFEGLHFGTNGLYTNRLTPPDVQVAVGPNHVVEMVNVLGRISTKQGVEVRTFPLYSFFGVPSTDFISDPKIHFDSASNRWFASITDVTTGSVLLEVSKSDDPTGLWNAYRVSTITGCADQPLLGFSNLVVIISANDFSSCTGGNPSYLGVQYWVLNKTDLLSGATPRTMSFGPDPTLFSVHPVQSLRSTDTQFMVSTGSGPTSTLTLFSIAGVPPGLALVTQQNFGIRSVAIPPRAPQLGSRSTLDTADNRVQDAMWADNRLWLSLGVGCTPTGDNLVRSCVRLIEVDTANGTIAQDFDIGFAGKYGTAAGWATFIAAMGGTVRFTVGYAVQGGGAGYLPPTLAYVADGRSVTVALTTNPAMYTVDAGTAWSVSALLGGSGANERWATNEAVSGIATRSETLAFHYSHQFSASFNYRVTGGGSGYVAPSVSYGQFTIPRANDSNLTAWVDAGSAYSFASSLGGSNATERWIADAPDRNGTVGASATVEIVYRHQALLTFGFQGPAESSMSPGTGWYDVGFSLTPTVTPAAGWAVGIWQGSGPGAYSGPRASPTIFVVGPISEIAILYPGLTIHAGDGGSVSFSFGSTSGTVASGSSQTLYVPFGTIVTIVASPSSTYTFTQWSGASSSNRSSVTVTVAGPAQVTAHFAFSAGAALAFYSAIAAVAIIAALVLIGLIVRRRTRRSQVPPPPPEEPPLPPPPPPP